MNNFNSNQPTIEDGVQSPRRGFIRHFEIVGDVLRVRDGAMLPDVCLYSGKEGKGLRRSTKLLKFCPLWITLIGFGALAAFVLLYQLQALGLILFFGLLAFSAVIYSRESIVIHYAYSLSSFLKRTSMVAVFFATVYLAVRLYVQAFDSGFIVWGFGGIIFALLIVVTPSIHGFRVKNIKEGWVTLAGVHPIALRTLAKYKVDALKRGKPEAISPAEQ